MGPAPAATGGVSPGPAPPVGVSPGPAPGRLAGGLRARVGVGGRPAGPGVGRGLDRGWAAGWTRGGPRADLVQLGVVDEVGPVPVDERAEAEAVLPAAGEQEAGSAQGQRRWHGRCSDVASDVLSSDLVLRGPVCPPPGPARGPRGLPPKPGSRRAAAPCCPRRVSCRAPSRAPPPPAQFCAGRTRSNWVARASRRRSCGPAPSLTPGPDCLSPASPVSVQGLSPEPAP